MITVKVFATFRRHVGNQKELRLNLPAPRTARSALKALFSPYPQLEGEILDSGGNIRPHVSVFVNGRDVRHQQGLDTSVEEGATLALFPPVAGG